MQEIELSVGIIEYEDTGGSGPVVVLLHGLVMDGSLWRHVVDRSPLSGPDAAPGQPSAADASGRGSLTTRHCTSAGRV